MNEVEKKQRMRPVNQRTLKKPMVEFDNKRSLWITLLQQNSFLNVKIFPDDHCKANYHKRLPGIAHIHVIQTASGSLSI